MKRKEMYDDIKTNGLPAFEKYAAQFGKSKDVHGNDYFNTGLETWKRVDNHYVLFVWD